MELERYAFGAGESYGFDDVRLRRRACDASVWRRVVHLKASTLAV
jgi:hypothetical protein